MKGIILAGGSGTRLYPLTKSISKQLLPVFDKPMIYYPLSVLLLAGIKEILIISTPDHIPLYNKLLGDGSDFGISLYYKNQNEPKGLAEAFIIGEDFIENEPVSLILGDNIFFGQGFSPILQKAAKLREGATIFGYYVQDPSRFGVVKIDKKTGETISLEEKPQFPESNYAIPGLYFYDNKVSTYAKSLKPSKRGELEITDLNRIYLNKGKLKTVILGRGLAWFDTGTFDGLLEASNFVAAVQKRQGLYIACLEEIAYNLGYIDEAQLKKLAKKHSNSEYGRYLSNIVND